MKKKSFVVVFVLALLLASCSSYYMPSSGRDDQRIYKIDSNFNEQGRKIVLGEVKLETRGGTGAFLKEAVRLYPDAEAVVDCYIDYVVNKSLFSGTSSTVLFRGVAVKQAK